MRKRFFGQYMVTHGLVAAPQLLEAVAYQSRSNSRLGELAVTLGFVTPFDAENINALQSREDLYFGEAAIKLGLMSQAQVNDLLATQKDGHVRLGEALVSLGHLSQAKLDEALSAFERQEAELAPELSLPGAWPGQAIARPLFELSPRLLLRSWDLASKQDDPRVDRDRVNLSDLNAEAAVHADREGRLLVGMPYAAAHKAASRLAVDGRPEDGSLRDLVRELTQVLGNQLTSVLAERGQRIEVAAARTCGQVANLPPGTLGVSVPHLTHVGKVLIALVL